MKQKLLETIKILTIAILALAGVAYAGPWIGPAQTFPNGNVGAPINVGSSSQTKTGAFWSQTSLGSDGGAYFGGSSVKLRRATAGPVEYVLYNGGGQAEWSLRQSAATDPTFRLSRFISGTYTDALTVDTSDTVRVVNKLRAKKLRIDGDADPVIGQVLTAVDANGNAQWRPQTFGGLYMKAGDSNTCRYSNPLTGACSCPSGYAEYQFWEWVNGVGDAYGSPAGFNNNVVMFQCIWKP
ncbi:MAG: hypothetical protein WC757_00595 [Candidatus Paceibacterota bacterium]|jgi:hypothetical protein